MAIVNLQNLCRERLFVSLSARYVEQYEFYSGAQVGTVAGKGKRGKVERPPLAPLVKNFDWGPLGGFTTIDLSAGYQLNDMIRFGISVTNLMDHYQREFVGSPSIGRLIVGEIKVNVPNKAKSQK